MTQNYNLKELPASERPRERLLSYGPEKLSCTELIAIILGSGTKGKTVLVLAQEILSHFGTLRRLLDASIEEICAVKGLGVAKALQLKAALSLAFRMSREQLLLNEKIDTPLKAYLYVRDFIAFEKKEIFGVILLDCRARALRWEIVSIGTLTQTIVHPREIFYLAVRHLAASLILVHNHPSGDPSPSIEDRRLTQKLIAASRSMAIPIIDHLIIGKKGFISLKESGLSFAN